MTTRSNKSTQSTIRRSLAAASTALLANFAFGPLATPALASVTLDFNGLQHGQIVDNEFKASQGVTVSAINRGGGPDVSVAFDTYATNTNDPDLQDPFSFGNAARDADGSLGLKAPGSSSSVSRFQKALSIQENGRESTNNLGFINKKPDDEGSRPAGSLFFDFDSPITEIGFDLLDIEGSQEYSKSNGAPASGYAARFFQDGAELARVGFEEFVTVLSRYFYDSTVQFGNNSANRIKPITAAQLSNFTNTTIESFDRVEINFGGSGAVDNLTYNSFLSQASVMPEASSLLIWGLLGLTSGVYRRRS